MNPRARFVGQFPLGAATIVLIGTVLITGLSLTTGPSHAQATRDASTAGSGACIGDNGGISVVLPQPEGPTSIVNSPAGTSKSIPCKTSTMPSPTGKDLVTPLHQTAMRGWFIAISPGRRSRGPPP